MEDADIQSTPFSLDVAGGGGVIDAGESAVGIGVVLGGARTRLAENAAQGDAAQSRRLLPKRTRARHRFARFVNLHRSGRLHVLRWALASGVSVGRGDSAIAGCPLRSQPPPPMQALHCANICSGGRRLAFSVHAVSSARWRTPHQPACGFSPPPACAKAPLKPRPKSRAWGLGTPASVLAPRAERAIFGCQTGAPSGVEERSCASIDAKSSRIVQAARVSARASQDRALRGQPSSRPRPRATSRRSQSKLHFDSPSARMKLLRAMVPSRPPSARRLPSWAAGERAARDGGARRLIPACSRTPRRCGATRPS